MKTITICTSASFYKEAIAAETILKSLGFAVKLPKTAYTMKQSNDFNVENYKTWYKNKDDYHKKTVLIVEHFQEIEKGDAILVLNYNKHGQKNYIGGNVLMEMAIGLYLQKKIYVLNELPRNSPFLEELLGMQPICLNGNLKNIV